MMSVFDEKLIKLNVLVSDKDSLFEMMIDELYQNEIISNKEGFLSAIKSREEIMSTGIGNGVAIPHTRHDDVNRLKVVVYILAHELDYNALDDKPVRIAIMLAVPSWAASEYMKTLGLVSKALYHETDRQMLINCNTQQEVIDFFKLKGDFTSSKEVM